MATDPVPWFVGGGALHPAEVARLLAYAATSGAAGVVTAGDMAVTQLPVAGTSVRAAVGGAVIPNLYPGGGQQSYIGRAASSTDIPVTATGSGSGRVDLVIARIDDPQYGGTVPADVTVGPYIRFDIIQNVAAGSTTLPAGTAYPAIVLARLDIPASTATITTSMITPLAKVVNAHIVPLVYVDAGVALTSVTVNTFTTALRTVTNPFGTGVPYRCKCTYQLGIVGAAAGVTARASVNTNGSTTSYALVSSLCSAKPQWTVDMPAGGTVTFQALLMNLTGSMSTYLDAAAHFMTTEVTPL